MAVPNEGTTALPSDSGSRYHLGGWDGSNYYALRCNTNGILKILLADANGNEVTKAEDAAHSSGDYGIMALAVRKDTASALAGTDADYIPLIVDASGRLHVAQSGLELVDDAAFTPATSKVLPIGATYQATPDEVNDNDIGAIRMTQRRMLINAAGYRNLDLNNSTPAPSGTDIVNFSGGALVAGDFDIRDTDSHFIKIPMTLSGWRKMTCSFGFIAFDQAATIYVLGGMSQSNSYAALATFSVTASASISFFAGGGGAVGQSGSAGGATAAANVFYSIPAIESGWQYILLRVSFSVAPTTGTWTTSVWRST